MTTELPLRRDVSLVYAMTWVVASLLFLSSIGGVFYGQRSWYDSQSLTLPALIGQDLITIAFGIPLLLASAHRARHGSLRGLLCWMGALFYVAYFYYFYVVGIRLNPLFPAYIAIVSMSMYGLLALLFSIELNDLKMAFSHRLPVRLIGGFLISTSLAFAALWLTLVVSAIAAGTDLDSVSRFVISIDGVVLLPLSFFGGLWLWQREPLGFALAGVLLVKLAATFLTLIFTTAVAMHWGQRLDPIQTAMYATGLIVAVCLLSSYLKNAR